MRTNSTGSSDARVTFSALIPTLKRPDLLRTALEALLRCDPPPDEIVVVDGDPGASALPVTESLGGTSCNPPIHYLNSERGSSRQRNRGMAHCRSDVIAFFDDDSRPEPDVFVKLGAAYKDPGVVGVTGRVIEPDDRRFGRESRLRRLLPGGGRDGTFTRFGYPRRIVDPSRSTDVEFMHGCFMSARTDLARRIGFDERLANYGLAEDEDFSCRLGRAGRLRYLADALTYHDNTGFLSRDRRAFGRKVVMNRAYLFRKNFAQTPVARAQFHLLLLVLVGHRVVNRDWLGARGLIEATIDLWRGQDVLEAPTTPPVSPPGNAVRS